MATSPPGSAFVIKKVLRCRTVCRSKLSKPIVERDVLYPPDSAILGDSCHSSWSFIVVSSGIVHMTIPVGVVSHLVSTFCGIDSDVGYYAVGCEVDYFSGYRYHRRHIHSSFPTGRISRQPASEQFCWHDQQGNMCFCKCRSGRR